jgi:tetratricopeptide (TPR) repeat protein
VDIAERAKIAPNERSVKYWLSIQKRPWLLLIDNVNNGSVENFFPPCESGLVLLTTRNQSLRTQGTFGPGYYRFTGLGEQDSIELLLRSADEPTPWKIASVRLATDICKTLGYLPLAIVQAGKAILKGECTLQTFRTFFERGWVRVRTSVRGKEHSDSFRTAPTPNEAVYSTFEIVYPAASEDAIELLKLLSFMYRQRFRFKILVQAIFNPDRETEAERMEQHQRSTTEKLSVKSWAKTIQDLAIGLRLLLMRLSERPILPNLLRGVEGLERDEVEDRLRAALAELRSISLVDHNEKDGSCSMHPLVHWWARERMSLAEQAIWCQSACNVLARAILIPPLDVEESDKELRRHMLPHIEHVRKREADIREKLRLRQRERRRPWPILPRVICGYEVRQLAKFAVVYADHGLWDKASELLLVVGEFVRQNLGVAHPLAVRALLLLSESYFWLSCKDKAISLQLEIYEACRALRGEEDILTLNVRDQLAMSLANWGHFREARGYQEKVVEGFKITRGADHADTLRAITHLGKIVEKFGEFDEAVKLHREALDGIQKDTRRHPSDSETLDVKQNLAMAILDRHRWGSLDVDELERAEQLAAEVIKQRESKLGKEHNSTLWAFCDLARIKAERGAVEEAEDIIRTRLPIAERNLGESHIGTLMGKTHFGHILILRGKLSEAEIILEQAVQSYEVNHKGHPDQVVAQGFLVQCYRRQGKDDKAIPMQGKVITGLRSFFEEGSPWELYFLKNFTF